VSGLASTACAAGFVVWAVGQEPPDASAAPAAVLLTMGAYSLATLWMCERWAALLWRVDRGLPRIEAYRSAALGLIGNACLPVRAGDAIRVGMVSTASEKLSARSSVGSLVAERALDVGCHGCLLAAVCTVHLGPRAGASPRMLAAIAGGLALLAVAVAAAVRLGRLYLSRRQLPARLRSFLGPIVAPLAGLRRESGGLVALTAGIWLAEILAWWAAAQAVGLALSPPQAAFVFAIATLALIVPVGFGAIGTLDAAIVLGLEALGVEATEILGFVLLLRVAFVLPSAFLAVGLGLARRFGPRPGQIATGGAASP
jgi:uncharacterized membrane protein YbhN (UPF0104 family)